MAEVFRATQNNAYENNNSTWQKKKKSIMNSRLIKAYRPKNRIKQ